MWARSATTTSSARRSCTGPQSERVYLRPPSVGAGLTDPAPMTQPLVDRVAIVTGGTGALGQAVTLRLLADGAVVAVPYAVEAERVRLHDRVAAADRSRLVLEPVDVTNLESMTAFARSLNGARGKIDVLVAGVGGFAGGSLLETGRETSSRMIDLNPTSAFSAATA